MGITPSRDVKARSWPWRAVAVACGVLAVGAAVLPLDARGAGDQVEVLPRPEPPAAAVRPGFTFKGAELCIRCHRSEQSEWVDLSTTAAWRHDAHARSHLALESANTRTRAMEEALGIKAARTAACVACHTHPAGEPEVEEESSVVHAGISCETCHGAGSGYFEPHMEKRWRFLSTAEKESLGMRDLRNPVRKAENCLSCHLGDPDSGKVVTHPMYAAGHPPLPAFEMEAFGRGMGPHWRRVWEKSPRVQKLAAEAGYQTEAADETHRTLIGALVALERTVAVVRDYAAPAGGKAWPELALYDCQACHHELRVPSWRQETGYGGLVPGRPSLVRWPRPLAGVAFAAAGMPTDIDALLAPYRDPLNTRPFGTAAGLRETTSDPLLEIARAIRGLQAVRRDDGLEARQRSIVTALVTAGENSGDFESARLLGWTLVAALDRDRSRPEDIRQRQMRRLAGPLALDFPQPEAGAAATPFWRTSLSAAAAADMDQIHAAFRLPAPDR